MADKLQELKDNFAKVSKQTQEAYDKLHGVAGRGGLEQGFLKTKKDFENISTFPKWAQEDIRSAYESSKPIYEAAQKEYADAQNQKNDLRKQIADAEKTAATEKTASVKAKSAENVYTKALADLSAAETKLPGYKGTDNYVTAYKAAQTAYDAAVKAGKNPVPLPQPKVEIPASLTPIGDQSAGTNQTPVAQPLNKVIDFLADPANSKILEKAQTDLKTHFGYTGPTDGKWSITFQNALGDVATKLNSVPAAARGTATLLDFIANPTVDLGFSSANAGGGSKTWGSISNPTQAKATINQTITNLLGREATDKEVATITKKLTAAQKANPFRQDANGMTIGGLDAGQFITDIVKTMPDYVKKVAAKQDLTAQTVESTLKANGIPYKPEQVKVYADRIKNGEDINTISNEIRQIASFGQPDSVKKLLASGTDLETLYAPYKRVMASSLGINPNTITLDDPTLRMAIGPDKEMSLYDYQKAIRQDSRWKYSQEANDEVTNMVNQVKRDFGFMG